MKKRALITGITGQDGSYLAELLLSKGYEVHGLIRRVSTGGTWRIDNIKHKLVLHEGDLMEEGSIVRVLRKSEPDEVYNLAAMSFVHASFEVPVYAGEVNGIAVARLLETIRNIGRPIRFYQASTSEMFGLSAPPQNELTRLHPRSPYAASKCFAHHMTMNYRESYGIFGCSGMLFNHESPRRGEEFVTRKIAKGAARISLGLDKDLRLGNLDAKRDWGFAGDYVEAMWLMLQQDEPADYVVATGETHSISEFADAAFSYLGLDWHDFVTTDPKFLRPADVFDLRGDPTRARDKLGWKPTVTFGQLVQQMVDAEVARARREIFDDR